MSKVSSALDSTNSGAIIDYLISVILKTNAVNLRRMATRTQKKETPKLAPSPNNSVFLAREALIGNCLLTIGAGVCNTQQGSGRTVVGDHSTSLYSCHIATPGNIQEPKPLHNRQKTRMQSRRLYTALTYIYFYQTGIMHGSGIHSCTVTIGSTFIKLDKVVIRLRQTSAIYPSPHIRVYGWNQLSKYPLAT
jgi:hypothetical protein